MVWNERAFRTIVDSHKKRAAMHLHETEVPVVIHGATVPVGYAVHTKDFSFMAIYETDGTVNVLVEWGDDQPDDMVNHPSMSEAKRHLDTLLKAAEPTPPVVVNVLDAVNQSVDEGLKKADIPNTPQNRVDVLGRMHTALSGDEKNRLVIQTIEDEIIRLQDELL